MSLSLHWSADWPEVCERFQELLEEHGGELELRDLRKVCEEKGDSSARE